MIDLCGMIGEYQRIKKNIWIIGNKVKEMEEKDVMD